MKSVEIRVSLYAYKLAGHQFELGDNPKVNAQFSIRYCAANGLLRGSSKLPHFDETRIMDDKVLELVGKIHVVDDPSLGNSETQNERFSTDLSVRMKVTTGDGNTYHKDLDIPRGSPMNPLTDEEHLERFYDCVAYADRKLQKPDIDKIPETIARIEKIEDVRSLIALLTPAKSAKPAKRK